MRDVSLSSPNTWRSSYVLQHKVEQNRKKEQQLESRVEEATERRESRFRPPAPVTRLQFPLPSLPALVSASKAALFSLLFSKCMWNAVPSVTQIDMSMMLSCDQSQACPASPFNDSTFAGNAAFASGGPSIRWLRIPGEKR